VGEVSEVEELARRVEWLEEALVLLVVQSYGGTDPELNVKQLRWEIRRRLPDLERRIARRLKRRLRDRTPRVYFDGENLSELREFLGGLASLVMDQGQVWMVGQGDSIPVGRGEWIEKDEAARKFWVAPPPEDDDELGEIYRTAGARTR
jgi:hypothetical protein